MSGEARRYLALGDSMSIDRYTGVQGGGAVSQFYDWLKWLAQSWLLDDRTLDGCCMSNVPRSAKGDLITLTIGGNDLLSDHDVFVRDGLQRFADEHFDLLASLRAENPKAVLIVGNIYAPQATFPDPLLQMLDEANTIIAANVQKANAFLADIRRAFRGHEQDYLCYEIEASRKGATVIAGLFKEAFIKAGGT